MAIGLTTFEKYPNSWRFDLPDFPFVQKGTVVKGVITDFQKIQDDPIQVAPLVKVDIGGDYLPLSYHPKAQYWDTPAHKAQDFNQDGGYFENAWQSFRGGDEVAVMVQEGTPARVIAFADGVPRLGEALFHVDWEGQTCEVQMASLVNGGQVGDIYGGDYIDNGDLNNWNLNMKGPDGADLKLLRPCIIHKLQDLPSVLNIGWIIDNNPPTQDPAPDAWAVFYKETKDIGDYKLFGITVPIGAILYLIPFIVVHGVSTLKEWRIGGPAPDPPPKYPPSGWDQDYPFPYPYGSWSLYSSTVTDDYYTVTEYYQDNLIVQAAVYQPELENSPSLSSFTPQSWGANALRSKILSLLFAQTYDNSWGFNPGFKIFVRPHTKVELQAAGMWPKAA